MPATRDFASLHFAAKEKLALDATMNLKAPWVQGVGHQ